MSEGGILTGPEIRKEIISGAITIDPCEGWHLEGPDSRINPASYDLTLGDKVAVYRGTTAIVYGGARYRHSDVSQLTLGKVAELQGRILYPEPSEYLDSKSSNDIWEFTMRRDIGWHLSPGIGYLMHTAERVTTKRFIPVLDGKSSVGRLFITVHVTAGYGDPGFDGQYTLEVVATQPVVVYPGMRFCQIRFHDMHGEPLIYNGNYVGDYSKGPVPSRSWRQFEKERLGSAASRADDARDEQDSCVSGVAQDASALLQPERS